MQKKKKKTVILVISGILVIAGTIAYFAWSKKETKKTIEDKDNPNQDNPDRNDEPDPEPTNKNKAKVKFLGKSLKNQDSTDFDSYKFMEGTEHIFYVSKNHPIIKELLSQNKLQKDKFFTIRYGKVDEKSDSGLLFIFNENNQELEIIEVKTPSPNPQPEKGFKWTSAKINDNTYKYKITLDGGEIDFSDFITLLKDKKDYFFKAFQGALKDANSKFPAYFWECPSVSEKTLNKEFEFVVIKSESLNSSTQNWTSFGKHISNNYQKWACSFPGLSGDNILVIPIPKPGPDLDFKNISQFTKNAPEEQQQELWKEVAEKLTEELKKGDAPRWLSTHGGGVSYLHVRIDEKPKYYSHAEYKK